MISTRGETRENQARFKRVRVNSGRRWTRDLVKDVAILVENAKRARSIALESILGSRDTEDLSAGTGTLAFTPNTV